MVQTLIVVVVVIVVVCILAGGVSRRGEAAGGMGRSPASHRTAKRGTDTQRYKARVFAWVVC